MIERNFDISFVAKVAQREKQIQQSYRPIIGVHKWFARRPGALYRALLLAEFSDKLPLKEAYFDGHELSGFVIGDPFMGGGTPLLEANRIGCHVIGVDINPMAYWIVRQELGDIDRAKFRTVAAQVIGDVEAEIGTLYETTCEYCDNERAVVKYFLWVKEQPCELCTEPIRLYTNYVIAKNQRHPNHVILCKTCETLNEVSDIRSIEDACCVNCSAKLKANGPARRNRVPCSKCSTINSYPRITQGPLNHHLFAIEYHCDKCSKATRGRFFKSPSDMDRERVRLAANRVSAMDFLFVPTEEIPAGDESDRLHRWGYNYYRDLFNSRQLLGLELLARRISAIPDDAIRHALLTVFSDTLRYQNMVCRYDSYALKIIDIFSIHGFPVQPIQCENSLLGIAGIGSGGFRHFVEKYDRAKTYCEEPFEKTLENKRKVFPKREVIKGHFVESVSQMDGERRVLLQATSAEKVKLKPNLFDAILTDPPYFGNVQYAELIDFCYVWLRRHLHHTFKAFGHSSTRSHRELTVNQTEGRDIVHFVLGLTKVVQHFSRALKPGSPFAFTYHHNEIEAYLPIVVALLDANLVVTKTIPCPAEMGASIHISGTKSSTLDTVFVCRTTGTIKASEFKTRLADIEVLLQEDVGVLRQAGLSISEGDAYCLLYGHLARIAVWELRASWDKGEATMKKLTKARSKIEELCPSVQLQWLVQNVNKTSSTMQRRLLEPRGDYQSCDTVSF